MRKFQLALNFFLLLFSCQLSSNAQELDFLHDIYPGKTSSNPYDMTRFASNKFLFFAQSDSSDYQLWITDADTAHTKPLEIFNTTSNTSLNQLTQLSGRKALFIYNNNLNEELWITDGTSHGTNSVKIFTNSSNTPVIGPVLNNQAFVKVPTGGSDQTVWQLWITDGTSSGTTLLADSIDYLYNERVAFKTATLWNNILLFYAFNPATYDFQLWRSDGTKTGTYLIKNFGYSFYAWVPAPLVGLKNEVVLSGFDSSNGWEVWKTDGTAGGTQFLKDVNPGSVNSNPVQFTRLNKKVFFIATDSSKSELWVTNGTASGTLPSPVPASVKYSFNIFGVANKKIFFHAGETNIERPWATDGTLSGTEALTDVLPGQSTTVKDTQFFAKILGTAYFIAGTANNAYKAIWSLYLSDGTHAGTKQIYQNPKLADHETIFDLTAASNNVLYFVNDGHLDQALNSYSAVNGIKTFDLIPNHNDEAQILATYGGNLFLSLNGINVGQEPYYLTSIPLKESVPAISDPKDALIYPNPSDGNFICRLPSSVADDEINSVLVFDLQGDVVFATNTLQGNQFNIRLPPSVSDGMYLVQMVTSKNNYHQLMEVIR